MDKNRQNSLIYNSLKLGRTQISIGKKLDKYILVHLENKVPHSYKNKL